MMHPSRICFTAKLRVWRQDAALPVPAAIAVKDRLALSLGEMSGVRVMVRSIGE